MTEPAAASTPTHHPQAEASFSPGTEAGAPEQPEVSMVLPVYNEEENLSGLLDDLLRVGRSLGRSFEIVLVDDGSSDGSARLIAEQAAVIPEVRAILLRRNFGQSAAMTAGFQAARGEIVVSLDSDRQNDPEDIPRLIAKLEQEDLDLVCGWRRNRRDRMLDRKLPSKAANWMIGRFTGVKLHDYGCSLKAYRRALTEGLVLYGELHRFIPVLVELKGARIAEMPVNHHPRTAGRSNYGISRLPRVLIDLMLMVFFQRFATRPLQLFGTAGLGSFAAGFLICSFLTVEKLTLGHDIGDRPMLLLGVLLILAGIILGGLGLVAELLVRVYFEHAGRRIYSVRREVE